MEGTRLKRYLVVPHLTLGGDDLVKEVRRRTEECVAAVHVVVPGGAVAAAARGHYHNDHEHDHAEGSGGGEGVTERPGDQSRLLLARVLDRLHTVVEEITGEVRREDPVSVVRDAMAAVRYDEVVLVVPPADALGDAETDRPVAEQVARATRGAGVPLTTIYGEPVAVLGSGRLAGRPRAS